MDTSQVFTGVQSADKWNYDGITGLQLQVEHELPNVDAQFQNTIDTAFEDSTEAHDLALELLCSKKIALHLCIFIQ